MWTDQPQIHPSKIWLIWLLHAVKFVNINLRFQVKNCFHRLKRTNETSSFRREFFFKSFKKQQQLVFVPGCRSALWQLPRPGWGARVQAIARTTPRIQLGFSTACKLTRSRKKSHSYLQPEAFGEAWHFWGRRYVLFCSCFFNSFGKSFYTPWGVRTSKSDKSDQLDNKPTV